MNTSASPSTGTHRYSWRVVDIVVASVIGVAAGLVFWLWGQAWPVLDTALAFTPGLSGLLAGGWLFAGVLGGLIIRKPGAALYTEIVAAVVSMAIGTQWGFTTLIWGVVQGLGAEVAERIVAVRAERPFADMADVARRAELTVAQMESLATAGAFDGFGISRRQASQCLERACGSSGIAGIQLADGKSALSGHRIRESGARPLGPVHRQRCGLGDATVRQRRKRLRRNAGQVRIPRSQRLGLQKGCLRGGQIPGARRVHGTSQRNLGAGHQDHPRHPAHEQSCAESAEHPACRQTDVACP